MTISDETLMAYLDNELAPDERARVAAALNGDAALRQRLARQQKVHEKLDQAFGPLVREPVPEHLVQLAMTAPVSWRWRAREAWRRFLSGGGTPARIVPSYALAFGTLVLGLSLWIAAIALIPQTPSDNAIMAQGALARALESKLASDDSAGPRVGVTFVAKNGDFCRTFDMALAADNAAGFACRTGDGWALRQVVPAESRTSAGYELASAGIPPAIRNAVSDLMQGDPLDAAAEKRARDGGWSH